MGGRIAVPVGRPSSDGQGAFNQVRPVETSNWNNILVEIIGRIVQAGALPIADENECSRSRRRFRVLASGGMSLMFQNSLPTD